MKQPILLKTLLDIAFIVLMFSFVGAIALATDALFSAEPALPLTINSAEISEVTTGVKVLLIAKLIVSGLFIYVIFLVRKLIRNFFRNRLFTRLQISLLNLIGQLIVLTTVAQGATDFFANLVLKDEISIGIKLSSSIGSFWFSLALGLFLMYLSKLFEQAKMLKEENELTV